MFLMTILIAMSGTYFLEGFGLYVRLAILYAAPLYGLVWLGRQIRDEGYPIWGLAIGLLVSLAGSIALALGNLLPQGTYWINLGEMEPTLQPGDLVATNQWARLWRDPRRGEIIALDNADYIGVLRVAAGPGDRVQMRNGRLYVNGEAMPQVRRRPFSMAARQPNECPTPPFAQARLARARDNLVCSLTRAREVLPDGRSYEVLDAGHSALDNTREFRVPAGHFFVLGDNRDWTRDSRGVVIGEGPGYVSRSAILGFVYRRVYPTGGAL
jgi:signal peptidase I